MYNRNISEVYLEEMVLNEGILDFVTRKIDKYNLVFNRWKTRNDRILRRYNLMNQQKKKRLMRLGIKSSKLLASSIRSGNPKQLRRGIVKLSGFIKKGIYSEIFNNDFSNVPKSILQGIVLALIISGTSFFLTYFVSGIIMQMLSDSSQWPKVVESGTWFLRILISIFFVPILQEMGALVSIKGGFGSSYIIASSVTETIRKVSDLIKDNFIKSIMNFSLFKKVGLIYVLNLSVRTFNSFTQATGVFLGLNKETMIFASLINIIYSYLLPYLVSDVSKEDKIGDTVNKLAYNAGMGHTFVGDSVTNKVVIPLINQQERGWSFIWNSLKRIRLPEKPELIDNLLKKFEETNMNLPKADYSRGRW